MTSILNISASFGDAVVFDSLKNYLSAVGDCGYEPGTVTEGIDYLDAEEEWDRLDTRIERVYDENGINMADAQVRASRLDRWWIYVDGVDGYAWITTTEGESLLKYGPSDD